MKIFYTFAAVAVVIVFIMLMTAIPKSHAQVTNSQDFSPSRFVVIAADINVDSPQMGGSDASRRVIMRLDTVTGRAWLLQVSVTGGNQPKIRESSWHDVGFIRNRNL